MPAEQVDAILARLRALARPEAVAGMAGFGLSGPGRLGLSMPTLRGLARELGRDHALALALWDTAIPDAQILASLLAEPEALTEAEMDHWVAGMAAWDVCDQACINALVKSPLAWAAIPRWAARTGEFERRAAFALLAVAAVHQKRRPHADFLDRLTLIEAGAADSRNLVKKAVSWALRQIGKRDASLLGPALALAEDLARRPEASARWTGLDARRELAKKAPSRGGA